MKIGYRNESISDVKHPLPTREVLKLELFGDEDEDFRNYEGMLPELCDTFNLDQDELESNYDIDELGEDEELKYQFVDDLIEKIIDNSEWTKEDFNYALWLCDSKKDVIDNYVYDNDDSNINAYYTSDLVLVDLGDEGKLFSYKEMPKPITHSQVFEKVLNED